MKRVCDYAPKPCERCGKQFKPRNPRHAWCDECLTKICEWCGNPYHITKRTLYQSSRFCSKPCKHAYRKENYVGEQATNYKNGNRLRSVPMKCDYCGKDYMEWGVQAGKWNKQFCGRPCQKLYYREHSDEVKGENSPRWKGGVFVVERTRFMQTPQYREWRRNVFARDGYECQRCDTPASGRLNAHHIKEYKDYPELRLELSNGVTLCNKCHKKAHSKELDIQSELP